MLKIVNVGRAPTVPYGETISFEEELICIQNPYDSKSSVLRVTTGLLWHKKCMIKKIIKINSNKESKVNWEKWRDWVAKNKHVVV